MLSYNTKIICSNKQDLIDLRQILIKQQECFNYISIIQYNLGLKNLNIKDLHLNSYFQTKSLFPNIPTQVIIRSEQEILSSYRSVISNKHKINTAIKKSNPSIRLDKRLYSKNKLNPYSIKITTINKRKIFEFILYPKLKSLLDQYEYCDPLLYIKNNEIWISFTFDTKPKNKSIQSLCLGVDLGIRVPVALSDGNIIIDKKFNGDKRKLRHLKRELQSTGTKSARKHLKQIRRKEKNKNKNQTHLLANFILKAKADTIALENLKGIKAKKHKKQNKNRISQVPLFDLRRILEYKANNMNKHVVLVNPAYTSQIDSISNKKEGERKGRRFYSKSGLIYDADINAARNIGNRSKLPVLYGNILDGQAVVNQPIVCKSIDISQ